MEERMPSVEPAPRRVDRSSGTVRWAHALLRLYPRTWRERYAEEVALVLDQHRVTYWTLLDFLLGALDARLHPDLLPGRLTAMTQRMRSSEVAIFCAFVLFVVPWLIVQHVKDPLPDWEHATALHPELLSAFIAVQITGLVALLAVLAGGVPLLLGVLRYAVRARRWQVVGLLLVPFVALAVLVGYTVAIAVASTQRQAPALDAPLTPFALLLQLGLLVLFVLAVAGSTAAVGLAVARSELSARLLRLVLVPATLATVGIAAGLLATSAFIVLCFVEAPDLNSPSVLVIIGVFMAAGTALAVSALRQGIMAARGSAREGAATAS
jgi:hypothetical protein